MEKNLDKNIPLKIDHDKSISIEAVDTISLQLLTDNRECNVAPEERRDGQWSDCRVVSREEY